MPAITSPIIFPRIGDLRSGDLDLDSDRLMPAITSPIVFPRSGDLRSGDLDLHLDLPAPELLLLLLLLLLCRFLIERVEDVNNPEVTIFYILHLTACLENRREFISKIYVFF